MHTGEKFDHRALIPRQRVNFHPSSVLYHENKVRGPACMLRGAIHLLLPVCVLPSPRVTDDPNIHSKLRASSSFGGQVARNPWLMFNEKVKTSRVYISTVSTIPVRACSVQCAGAGQGRAGLGRAGLLGVYICMLDAFHFIGLVRATLSCSGVRGIIGTAVRSVALRRRPGRRDGTDERGTWWPAAV